jgi:hypothetical protein
MSPRKKVHQPSDTDSDSSDGNSRQRILKEEGYRSLQLDAALRRPADFATAAAELAACLRQLFTGRCSKATQGLMLEDVRLAIDCCDT